MMRRIRWGAYALIAILAVGWAAVWALGGADRVVSAALNAGGGASGAVSVGGPFTLVDTRGQEVTDASFRGRWMLVYFGYTFCPDVCPTELQTMVTALDSLGEQGRAVAPVFVTVDPERDTPAALADYVKLFDDRLVGLTGSPAQIAAVTRAYRVYYAKATLKDRATYLMDHSSFLYLMGPDGRFRALFRQGTTVQELADAIRVRLAAAG